MKNKILYCLVIFFFFAAKGQNCEKAKKKLSAKISGYTHELLYALSGNSDKDVSDVIWEKKTNRCAIITIINDSTEELKNRFFAAEILLEKQDTLTTEIKKGTLAKIYSDAIEKNAFGTLNYWGMFNANDAGPAGEHLLKIGETAIPFLTKVLDSNEKMHYWGSKSADVGNAWRYRAKDVAAFFIFKIKKQTFEWTRDPEERDKIIALLKESLKK